MVKAQFKTAYLQRELVVDTKVAANMEVGTVVTMSGSGDTTTITAVADTVLTPADTHYIVAQSDMTMSITKRDYTKGQFEYDDSVKASTTLKKVALFKVIDPSDVTYKVKA